MTPAESIFTLTADENGDVDLGAATTAIVKAITDLVEEDDAQLTGTQAVELLTYHITHVASTLAELLMSTQAAVVSSHQAIENILFSKTDIEDFDEEKELATLLLSFDIARKARTLDMLSATVAAREDDES